MPLAPISHRIAACAIWAADPFLGEWKLNVDKSDFGSRDKAKKGSTKYKLQLGGYMYESETDYGNGHKARLGMPVEVRRYGSAGSARWPSDRIRLAED